MLAVQKSWSWSFTALLLDLNPTDAQSFSTFFLTDFPGSLISMATLSSTLNFGVLIEDIISLLTRGF